MLFDKRPRLTLGSQERATHKDRHSCCSSTAGDSAVCRDEGPGDDSSSMSIAPLHAPLASTIVIFRLRKTGRCKAGATYKPDDPGLAYDEPATAAIIARRE